MRPQVFEFLLGQSKCKVIEKFVRVARYLLVEALCFDAEYQSNILVENDAFTPEDIELRRLLRRAVQFLQLFVFAVFCHVNLEVAFCDLKMRT